MESLGNVAFILDSETINDDLRNKIYEIINDISDSKINLWNSFSRDSLDRNDEDLQPLIEYSHELAQED